jgi:hypothetical protein
MHVTPCTSSSNGLRQCTDRRGIIQRVHFPLRTPELDGSSPWPRVTPSTAGPALLLNSRAERLERYAICTLSGDMSVRRQDRTRKAVENCIAVCGMSPFPNAALMEFLMFLRLNGQWSSGELVDLRSDIIRRLTDVPTKSNWVLRRRNECSDGDG